VSHHARRGSARQVKERGQLPEAVRELASADRLLRNDRCRSVFAC
jgi:hypothetical protein